MDLSMNKQELKDWINISDQRLQLLAFIYAGGPVIFLLVCWTLSIFVGWDFGLLDAFCLMMPIIFLSQTLLYRGLRTLLKMARNNTISQ
jgi:hypothetical protein